MSKKIIAALLCVFIVTLSGCGSAGSKEQINNDTEPDILIEEQVDANDPKNDESYSDEPDAVGGESTAPLTDSTDTDTSETNNAGPVHDNDPVDYEALESDGNRITADALMGMSHPSPKDVFKVART